MMESLGLLVEKAVESSIEKCPTFFDQLESSLEVAKPEIEKNLEKAEKFWDSLMSGENLGEAEPQVARLSDEEKAKIKEETGWSDEIIDRIENMDQYEILKKAHLVEVEINGKVCLVKENIDLNYVDADGISNRERMERGLAPLDPETGNPIELHHLGQKEDSPLVELTAEEHRTGDYEDGKKNQSLWHDNTVDTDVHGEGNNWAQERKAHWEARAENARG